MSEGSTAVDTSGGEWERHFSEDGSPYFYNTVTQEVQWDVSETAEPAQYGESDAYYAEYNTSGGEDGQHASYYGYPEGDGTTFNEDATYNESAGWQQEQPEQPQHSHATAHCSGTVHSWEEDGGQQPSHERGNDEVVYDVDPDSYASDNTVIVHEEPVNVVNHASSADMYAAAKDNNTTPEQDVGDGTNGADDSGTELAEGWQEVVDEAGTYFWNPATGESRWERPPRLVRNLMSATSVASFLPGAIDSGRATGSHAAKDQHLGAEIQPKALTTAGAKLSDPADTTEEKVELEVGWEEQKDENGYTYYWNSATGESRWEAPLRRAISKIGMLRALNNSSKKKALTAEEVIAEHQRRYRPSSPGSHRDDDGEVIPCPADFDPKEWAAMPRDLQKEMADGADDDGLQLQSEAGNQVRVRHKPKTNGPSAPESTEILPASRLAADTNVAPEQAAATEVNVQEQGGHSCSLGVMDNDGNWQQVAKPKSAVEISEAVDKRKREYTNELARLRVKDLRNLSASLQLSTIGLRPDLTSRLVEKEAAALRDKLEAEAKIQGEKFRKANRASLRISVTSTPRSSGATPLTSPQDYTPGSALRVNSRQLMQHRKRAVRSELQAVEKVVSIDKKLASDATLSVAHRQRLAAIAARKDELNAALLNSCGLTGLKRLRRVGIQGHHFDEYCRELEEEVYDVDTSIRGGGSHPVEARIKQAQRRKSRLRSGRRQSQVPTTGRRGPTVPGEAAAIASGVASARGTRNTSVVVVNDMTTSTFSGLTGPRKTYFYHSPKLCRVWGVSMHRMPQHVPLLIPSPAENRLEGDFSASFVCGVALGWLHTQQLEDIEDRERKYRAWYNATHVPLERGTHDRQEVRAGSDGGRVVDAAERRKRAIFEKDMATREAAADVGPIAETRKAWAQLVAVSKVFDPHAQVATTTKVLDEARMFKGWGAKKKLRAAEDAARSAAAAAGKRVSDVNAAIATVLSLSKRDSKDAIEDWRVYAVNPLADGFPAAARAVSAVLCPIKQKEDLRSYPDGIAAKARDLPSQSSDVPSIPSHFAYNARTLRGRWVMLGGGYSSLTTEGSSIGVDSGPVSVENIPISVGAQAEAELDERWEKEARRRKRWQEKADEAVRAEKERRGMYAEDISIHRRRAKSFLANNRKRIAFQVQQKRKFDRMSDELAKYGNWQLKRLQWRSALACHPDGNTFLLHDAAKGYDVVLKESVVRPEDGEFCLEAFMCLRNHCAALGTDAHVAQIKQTFVTPLLGDRASNRVRFGLLTRFAGGGTLVDRAQHRVPPPQALSWVRQICAGLAALHDCKMAHGHLNPNAVCFDEVTGGVVLGNANISRSANRDEAKSMEEDLTNVGHLLRLMVSGTKGRTHTTVSTVATRNVVRDGNQSKLNEDSNRRRAAAASVPWSNGRTVASLLDALAPQRAHPTSAHEVIGLIDRGMVLRVSNLAIPLQADAAPATETLDNAHHFHFGDIRRQGRLEVPGSDAGDTFFEDVEESTAKFVDRERHASMHLQPRQADGVQFSNNLLLNPAAEDGSAMKTPTGTSRENINLPSASQVTTTDRQEVAASKRHRRSLAVPAVRRGPRPGAGRSLTAKLPVRFPAKPMRKPQVKDSTKDSHTRVNESSPVYQVNVEKALCRQAAEKALANHAVFLMTTEGRDKLQQQIALSARLRTRLMELLPNGHFETNARLKEAHELFAQFDLNTGCRRERGSRDDADDVVVAVVVDFFRGLFHDDSNAREAEEAVRVAEAQAARKSEEIRQRLLERAAETEKNDSEASLHDRDEDQITEPTPDVTASATSAKLQALKDESTQVKRDDLSVSLARTNSSRLFDPLVSDRGSSLGNASNEVCGDKSSNTGGESDLLISRQSTCDELAQAVFAALDMEKMGTVSFHKSLYSWFRRQEKCLLRVQALQEECAAATATVRADGSIGTRAKIARLQNELTKSILLVETRCDEVDARERMSAAKVRDAETAAVLKYREYHPPPAPPLWSQVALLRRMNEVGLMQRSNYDQQLLDLGDEGGAFRRQLLGTEDVDEGKGIFNEYDYDWDLAE